MSLKTKIQRLALLFPLLSLQPTFAEKFTLEIKNKNAKELRKVAAMEINLQFNPENSFLIAEDFEIYNGDEKLDKEILYKVVDQKNHKIRIFFDDKPESTLSSSSVLNLRGDLERSNFGGVPDVKIASVNYVSRFSKFVDDKKIKLELNVLEEDDVLPFLGISKAEILGPLTRNFSDRVYISISKIETYGFSIDKKIAKVSINGQKAQIVNNEIIYAELDLSYRQEAPKDLDIELEIEVDNHLVSKKIGKIKFNEQI